MSKPLHPYNSSFARSDGVDEDQASDSGGTASLLIGASHLNRVAPLSLSNTPASVKLQSQKRKSDSEPAYSPASPPEEEPDDSGSDYDPSPRRSTHTSKRQRQSNSRRSTRAVEPHPPPPASPVASTVSVSRRVLLSNQLALTGFICAAQLLRFKHQSAKLSNAACHVSCHRGGVSRLGDSARQSLSDSLAEFLSGTRSVFFITNV